MSIFIFLYAKLSISADTSNFHNITNPKYYKAKKENIQVLDQGFTSFNLQGGETFLAKLKQNTLHLFYFIPYNENIHIQELKIDGFSSFYDFKDVRSLCVEGSDNVIIKFSSTQKSSTVEANFWLIPTTLCRGSVGIVYGKNIIDIKTSKYNSCIFSPSFDSNDVKYKIQTQIKNDKYYHYAKLYSDNFENPDFMITGEETKTITVKKPNFVEYYFTNLASDFKNYQIFYKRQTNSKNLGDKNNCVAGETSFKCTPKSCKDNSFYMNYIKCQSFDYKVFIIIVSSVAVGVVVVIAVIVVACICWKRKKKREEEFRLNSQSSEKKIIENYTNSHLLNDNAKYFSFF